MTHRLEGHEGSRAKKRYLSRNRERNTLGIFIL